jgi:glucose-1-phosphate cytidylyltransferase
MKVLILAGGFGTRLSEETILKPKPMAEIGDRPILWHIMRTYAHYGFNEFVVLLGYKGSYIKEYFYNYYYQNNSFEIDIATNQIKVIGNNYESWKVTLLDTGLNTMTGGRVKRAKDLIGNEDFMLTYGDGVADINLHSLLSFHNSHDKMVTMTGIQPEGRFGALEVNDDNMVTHFLEKPKGDGKWINGGFFVCKPQIFEFLTDDNCVLEREPLEKIASAGQLYVYKHHGFWKCMDTLSDKNTLNTLWNNNQAKWKVW